MCLPLWGDCVEQHEHHVRALEGWVFASPHGHHFEYVGQASISVRNRVSVPGLEADEVARHALLGAGRERTDATAPTIVRCWIAAETGHSAADGPGEVACAPLVLRVTSGQHIAVWPELVEERATASARVGRSIGLGAARGRSEPCELAPVEDPFHQIAPGVPSDAKQLMVAFASFVGLAAPDANRSSAGRIVEVGQEHVAHINVDQVGRSAGQDSAEGCREGVLKFRE
eukprot:721921-Rhodomonas_salina.4